MKKSTFFLAIVLGLVSNSAMAQTATDQVTLNVKLHPIQTLVVNAGQKTVDLNYTTKADYSDGVAVDQADHLSIYSTGAFAINVKSSSDKLTGTSATIDANTITLTPSLGTSQLTGSTLNTVTLSNVASTIISNTVGGVDKTFNIKYTGADADAYVNKYFNAENPTVYTTTVIYTIEAQ